MRASCRGALVALLVAELVNLPAATAANRALGFVSQAQASQIDGIAAASGTNVFAGDALSTETNGRIGLELGANQVYLPASSAATLASGNDGLVAVLSSGTLEFASPQGAGISVRALDVLIRPKTPQTTHAQITVLAGNELKIAAVAGPLELELDGELYTLTPGRTYDVKVVDGNAKDQGRFRSARKNRSLVVLLFGGAAVAAGIIYLVQELNESPEVP